MIKRFLAVAAVMGALSAGRAQPAHAQLGWTLVGVGEIDTEDVYLALAGVSVSPRRPGWSPVGGVTVFWLQFPVGGITDATRSVTSITPSVGVKNAFTGGTFSFRVDYSFKSSDVDGSVPVFIEGGGDGVVNTAQLDYWGSGSYSAQAIASYNYGSSSFWGRGRVGKRLMTIGDAGALALGAEAAYLSGDDYNASKVGGVVMFNPGAGTQLNFAVGRKLGGENMSDATYFTFELVFFPH